MKQLIVFFAMFLVSSNSFAKVTMRNFDKKLSGQYVGTDNKGEACSFAINYNDGLSIVEIYLVSIEQRYMPVLNAQAGVLKLDIENPGAKELAAGLAKTGFDSLSGELRECKPNVKCRMFDQDASYQKAAFTLELKDSETVSNLKIQEFDINGKTLRSNTCNL